jgi:hypothetical protein
MKPFSPSQIELGLLARALSEGKLDHGIYDKIMGRKGMLLEEAQLVASAAGLPRYPQIRLLPGASVDIGYNAVNAGKGVPVIEGGNWYLAVELSGPYLTFIDRIRLRGILGHELIHYIRDTLDLYNAEGKEGIVLHKLEGVDLDRLSNEERHALFYDDPARWFKDSEVLRAVRSLDKRYGKRSEVADDVLDLVRRGVIPVHEFVKGTTIASGQQANIHYTDVGQAVISIAIGKGVLQDHDSAAQ